MPCGHFFNWVMVNKPTGGLDKGFILSAVCWIGQTLPGYCLAKHSDWGTNSSIFNQIWNQVMSKKLNSAPKGKAIAVILDNSHCLSSESGENFTYCH